MTQPITDKPLLETTRVSKAFGGLLAVCQVELKVRPGTVHSIIGPNGAGKTTLFNLLAGVFPPTSGSVFFNGDDISRLKTYQRARIGIGRSYQVTSIFPELTVHENVRLAVQARHLSRVHLFRRADSLKEIGEKADSILEEMRLIGMKNQLASTIPYGSQRALDVAIAMAGEPKLLLLDEPTSGMSPDDTYKMIELVERLSSRFTVALIEHHMKIVMSISDVITVLNQGKVIAEGSPSEIQQSDEVRKAYLGGGKF